MSVIPRRLAALIASPGGFASVVAVAAVLWAWVMTSPGFILGINWDTASYLAAYGSGQGFWGEKPWNSHLAIGNVYLLGGWFMRAGGGTWIEGARLVNALSTGVAAGALAYAGARVSGRAALGIIGALLWLTSWGVCALVFTVEDNVLYFGGGVALLALALLRIDHWRLRDSLLAGALGALAALMSWQAGVYLFPPLFVAAVYGGTKALGARIRDVALIPASFVTTVLLWVIAYAATSAQTVAQLLRVVASRPEPSFFPKSLAGLVKVLGDPRLIAEHAGHGVVQELWPTWVTATGRPIVALGALLLIVALMAGIAGLTLWLLRGRSEGALGASTGRRLAMLGIAFLAITAAAALYLDLPEDKYKRYDHLPLFAAVTAVVLLGAPALRDRKRLLVPAAVLLGVLVLLQAGVAISRTAAWRAQLPSTSPPNYRGHGTEAWYQYIRRLRDENPQACQFVFALDEVAHARWQQEITASLWSELPDHLIIGDPAAVAGWRRKVKVAPAAEVKAGLRGCAWISPAAQPLLR